jgi:hypothetical protein
VLALHQASAHLILSREQLRMPPRTQFPQTPHTLFELMEEARSRVIDWRFGRRSHRS